MIQELTTSDLRNLKKISSPIISSPPIASSIAKESSLSDSAQKIELVSKEESNSSCIVGEEKKYSGDYIEKEMKPLRDTGYQKLNFPSPFDLVSFYNSQIKNEAVTLHPWQLDVSDTLAEAKASQQSPYKFCLCACNGSGKDAFVIAPFALWFCLCKIQSRCIITSSSGVQLTAQTESYIRSLAQAVNEWHKEEIFKIRQRYIRCNLTGSEIRLFATDEEGKAEGYHPIEAGTEMAIIINEAKSVAPEIFRALRRCTGYNYWIEVSTPGAPHGDFYTHFTRWSARGNALHVTTYDCPHLSAQEREEDKIELGEHSALFRSKHLALFTSEEGQCIIPIEVVERNRNLSRSGMIKKEHQDWPLRIGIDLAAGGDENSCYGTIGNCIKAKLNFREKDTTVTSLRISAWLDSLGIQKEHDYIFADDGGVGHGIIDQLRNYGWNIKRLLNQSASSDKKLFINMGAQKWYQAKRIFEENCWYFDPNEGIDDKLFSQLSNRYYKQGGTTGRIALESKAEAKAEGRPSPDRADALILSLTGLTVSDFLGESKEEKKGTIPPLNKREGFKTNEEIVNWQEEQLYNEYQTMNGDTYKAGNTKPSNSLMSLLRRKQSGYSFNPNRLN